MLGKDLTDYSSISKIINAKCINKTVNEISTQEQSLQLKEEFSCVLVPCQGRKMEN